MTAMSFGANRQHNSTAPPPPSRSMQVFQHHSPKEGSAAEKFRDHGRWLVAVSAHYSGVKFSDTVRKELIEELKFPSPAEAIKRATLPNPTKLELDADKVVEMKRCWAKAGVPADTRIVDFVMQPIFEQARQEVAVCMLKLATTPFPSVGTDADLT